MADIALNAAVRQSLLALQNTTKLINRTSDRLSTGLKVASPIDDPVALFQAKSLDDRALDFAEKKDNIGQGISTVTAALDGVDSIESLVRQMKGVVNSMKSATQGQMAELVSQFNELRSQINNLASDSTYQGTNLINGTGTTLDIEFSNLSGSRLNVRSVDLTTNTAGLNIVQQVAANNTASLSVHYASANHAASTAVPLSPARLVAGLTTTGTIAVTWQGGNHTYSAGSTVELSYGTTTLTVTVGQSDIALTQGATINIGVGTAAAATGFTVVTSAQVGFAYVATAVAATAAVNTGTVTFTYNGPEFTFTTANVGSGFNVTFNGSSLTLQFAGTGLSLTQGATFTVTVNGSSAPANGFFVTTSLGVAGTAGGFGAQEHNAYGVNLGATVDAFSDTYAVAGDTAILNAELAKLDSALETLRTEAQSLGTNVAILQTRLDFTERYVNTLEEGSSKLTLADINAEGANLLALQTRQQLGIQSLSFAGQAEQSILTLFR